MPAALMGVVELKRKLAALERGSWWRSRAPGHAYQRGYYVNISTRTAGGLVGGALAKYDS